MVYHGETRAMIFAWSFFVAISWDGESKCG